MPPAVYLDNHATTPVDPRVLEAMLPWLGPRVGNAGSRSHSFGWAASAAVEDARERVAALLGAEPREIHFTSGATEADNLAIQGICGAHSGVAGQAGRLVASAIEHHAVIETCLAMRPRGFEVAVLPVDGTGRVDPADVASAATPGRTALVAVMAANNEVGTIQPIAEIGRICRDRGVTFLCDAAQAVGRIPVDVRAWKVDLLALSAHKLYGPQGVGVLFVRAGEPRVRLEPLFHGGGQERGVRPGTLNVPGIVGMGAAATASMDDLAEEGPRLGRLRDGLQASLLEGLDGVHVNGHPTERLPGNLNVSFEGIESDALLLACPLLAISTGSACASGTTEPSPVLRAMGVSDALARASVRFGLGRFTTEGDVATAGRTVIAAVRGLRKTAPSCREASGMP